MRLFQRRRQSNYPSPVLIPTDFPTGTAVCTEEGIYFIKNKTKFKLYSDRCATSWRFDYVIGTLASISKFTYGGYLGFRDGSLIQNVADGKIYLVSANKRRHIQSPDVFARYGLNRQKIIEVSEAETNLHQEGEPLN